jgi:hypothetical protein
LIMLVFWASIASTSTSKPLPQRRQVCRPYIRRSFTSICLTLIAFRALALDITA